MYSDQTPFPIESALCRKYGVSRTSVREAVKMLAAKGLIDARPRRGTWVRPQHHWSLLDPDVLAWLLERRYDAGFLRDLNAVRAAVEPTAAELVAAMTVAQKGAVATAAQRMQRAACGDEDPLESEIAFHATVLRATCNPFYAQFIPLTSIAIRLACRAKTTRPHFRTYRKLTDALMAGHAAEAARTMQALLQLRDPSKQNRYRK